MDRRESLIEVPDSLEGADNSLPTELQEVQDEKYTKALTNLITGKTPKDVVFQKPAGKGTSVDYVPGWWFVQQLNALFGYRWDFEILDKAIGDGACWVLGKLTILDNRGNRITKTSFGGSRLKSISNPAIDIGDDLKSAATDALKKAATLLGIAADIYGRRETQEETKSKAQNSALFSIADKKGMNREQLEKFCQEEMYKSVEELTEVEVLQLINSLRTKANP